MKREIKFRAKAKHYDPMVMPATGLVEGFYYEDLCNGETKSFIKNSEMTWEVDKETVISLMDCTENEGKKEFKIGEVFQCGLVKLKCEKVETYSCDGCFLSDIFETQGCCKELVGECDSMNREDKTDVIFVKVEE